MAKARSWPNGSLPIPARNNPTGETDDPCGPGFVDDLQTSGLPDGGSGDHPNPQPPARFRRQPVFGKPLPDFKVSAWLPTTLWVPSGCSFFSLRSSSPGITTSTAIPDWAFSLLLWFIMVWRRKRSSGGAPFSTQPTVLIPSALSVNRLNRSGAPQEVWINKPQNTPENKNSITYASRCLKTR